MLIILIIRLLFSKQVKNIEREISYEIKVPEKDVEKAYNRLAGLKEKERAKGL